MNTKKELWDIIRFYGLWQWEYQRRNPVFIKDYYSMLSLVRKKVKVTDDYQGSISYLMRSNPVLTVDKKLSAAYEDFENKYGMHCRCPKSGSTFDIIFESILKGYSLTRLYENPDISWQFNYIIETKMDKLRNEKDGVNLIEWQRGPINKIVLEIDVNKPLEGIIDAVRGWYYGHNCIMSSSDEKKHNMWMQKYIASTTTRINRYFKRESGQNFKLNSKPRAVGLWLWEYTKQNNCGSTTAINAFRKAFANEKDEIRPIEKLGYKPYTEDRVFSRLLTNTQRCIDAMEVLSLSV